MLGNYSDFSPIDLLGTIVINGGATWAAASNADLRVGIKMKNSEGVEEVPPWADFRFLGGVAAAVVAQFGGPTVARFGHDVAVGALNSYVSTEICRKKAIDLCAAQAKQAPPAQITESAPAAGKQGAKNYAYAADEAGW